MRTGWGELCDSTIHEKDEKWPAATVGGTFRNPWTGRVMPTQFCANCWDELSRIFPDCFTPYRGDLVRWCGHWSYFGAEGPVAELGRYPVLWECVSCGTVSTEAGLDELRVLTMRADKSPGWKVYGTL